jgi:type IV pilus secretin PilQ/predicted competence protein
MFARFRSAASCAACLALVLLLAQPGTAGAAGHVTDVLWSPVTGGGQLQVVAAGDVVFTVANLAGPDRLVIDCLGGEPRRVLPPSLPADGPVRAVTVESRDTAGAPGTRLICTLAAGWTYRTRQLPGRLTVTFASAAAQGWPGPLAPELLDARQGLPSSAWAGGAPQPADPALLEITPGRDNGKTVSLDVQGSEIGTVLRSLASYSGTNIVASPRVTGKVTVRIDGVPWREAMTVILRAHGYDYIEEYGIIRVDTAEELRKEAVEGKRADRASDDLEPLVMGMVGIDYANADEVKGALKQMLTKRGTIEIDKRTNTLIVSDIQSQVDLVKEAARNLDTRTPQVEINARLVDMDLRASRELGIVWSANNVKVAGVNAVGSGTVNAPIQGPAGSLRFGTVQSYGDLALNLQALETANLAHLISNPVITTTDNREASILVGQKIPLIVQDQAGNAITQLTTIGILLKVTPHINSNEKITLDLHNEVSDLSSQATVQGGVIINTSESDTRVLVQNNETAIIGGLIRSVEAELSNGVPVLQDLPLLGALFRHSSRTKNSRELVIFVTPRIVTDEYLMRDKLTMESRTEYKPEAYKF